MSKAVVFRVESYADCCEGVYALTPQHHAEVANYQGIIALQYDADWYREMAAKGALHLVIARETFHGAIVGYVVHVLLWHPHYKDSLTAQNDVFYLHPLYRKGPTGLRMWRFAIAKLRELGVQRQIVSIKIPGPGNNATDLTPLMRHLGFTPTETVYTMLLDRKD